MNQRKANKSAINSKDNFKITSKTKHKNPSQPFFFSNILHTQFPVSLSDFSERYYFPFQYQFQQDGLKGSVPQVRLDYRLCMGSKIGGFSKDFYQENKSSGVSLHFK